MPHTGCMPSGPAQTFQAVSLNLLRSWVTNFGAVTAKVKRKLWCGFQPTERQRRACRKQRWLHLQPLRFEYDVTSDLHGEGNTYRQKRTCGSSCLNMKEFQKSEWIKNTGRCSAPFLREEAWEGPLESMNLGVTWGVKMEGSRGRLPEVWSSRLLSAVWF